ncbi:MAG: mmr [Candidatus Saccharibacteria bacterium]|nr:mmr [Candidatus Saccharibacteria bacterium]
MTKQQRLVLIVSIVATFLSGLDASVVNVALPAIVRDLGGGLPVQQWVNSSYAITLGSLILVAGSLSDIFGRKRILMIGVIGFGLTSAMCALAPSALFLILSRGLQGVFGALLVPSSLALIIAYFSGAAQTKAVGTWTGWGSIAFLVGPLVGGTLIDTFSWRFIFLINIIPAIIVLLLMRGLKTEKQRPESKVDMIGAVLCTIGLGAIVTGFIEQPVLGWQHPLILGCLVGGLIVLGLFLWLESHIEKPMLPLSLFKVRNFSAGNLATLSIYAGLAVSTFLLTIFLQQVGHYTALNAGLSILPITFIMFFLSPRFGALAGRFGPRLFMTAGPLIAALGFSLFLRVDASANYLVQVLPGIIVFGLGLSMTVAPLTAAVLSDIDKDHAGIGSAVNNAVARIAGLLAISSVGVIIGVSLNVESFHTGIIAMVFLLTLGGITSLVGIRNHPHHQTSK